MTWPPPKPASALLFGPRSAYPSGGDRLVLACLLAQERRVLHLGIRTMRYGGR